MSAQTRAKIITELGNAIKILDETRRFGNSGGYPAGNSTNLVSLINTLQISYGGDFLDDTEQAIQAIRAAIAGAISPNVIAAAIRPFLKQFCKDVIGRTDLTSDDEMWVEMYRYCQTTPAYVQSRAFTFGTPAAAAGNIGNGQIIHLSRDKYNFPIESEFVDSKRALCVLDENTGSRRGQEVFEVKGQSPGRDQLERSGSGLRGLLVGKTIDDSILNNPGFRSPGGAAPASLTSWTATAGDGASFYSGDSTNFFRAAPSDANDAGYALKLIASNRFQQKLINARQTQLSTETPYIMVVVWNRSINGTTGTLNIRMGSVTTSITVSAQTGWNVSWCPDNANPVGYSAWYRQFAQADMVLEVEWIQSSGTGLLIGEIMMIPGTQPLGGGRWYWAIPASGTYAQWRISDQYTWPDIATGSAKFQTFINRGFPGVYLPSSNGSSVTFTEP